MTTMALVALLALAAGGGMILLAVRRLRRRPALAVALLLGGLPLLAVGLLTVALGIALQSWQRLAPEVPVARLAFAELGPQRYRVRLTPSDGPPWLLELHGDQWQLEARLIVWAPWLRLLGAAPVYRLDRLGGRYADPEQARRTLPTLVSLDPAGPLAEWVALDRWAAATQAHWPATLPVPSPVSARYGSAVYLPMADGAVYDVVLGASGLLARPANAAAAVAIERW